MATLPRPQTPEPAAIIRALALAFDMLEHYEPWHRVGDKDEPGFQNAWVNSGGTFDDASFRKDVAGIVWLKGTVKSGTVGALNPIFTLPDGYRPPKILAFPTASNNLYGQINVLTTGDVAPAVGSNVSFHLNICFRAA